ncbi:hypothetical protein KM043_005900 [Ampulex compressa]|nr:hypothetical protein KM043_005900 [Ampulex compressa]
MSIELGHDESAPRRKCGPEFVLPSRRFACLRFGLIQLSLLRHTSSFLKMKSESNSPVGFEPGRIVGAFAKFNPGVSSSSHEENSYQQA